MRRDPMHAGPACILIKLHGLHEPIPLARRREWRSLRDLCLKVVFGPRNTRDTKSAGWTCVVFCLSLSLPGVGIEALKQCCQEIGWDLEVDIEAVCRRTAPSQAAIRFIIREGVPAGRGLAMTPGIESRLVSSQAPAFFPSPSRGISPFSPDPWCHFLSRLKSTTNSHGHTGPEPVFSSYTRAYMQSSSPGHRWR